MFPRPGLNKACLFNSRWKNTADVYLSPELHSRGLRVPSLLWFCLQCLSEFPDQVQLPFKLTYRPSNHQPPNSFRMVDEIFRNSTVEIPLDERSRKSRLSKLDPRLWAVIIQVFDHIPLDLRTYTLALNDELLPIIQGIKNTDKFSLITILELPGCPGLTDDSISELRCLHTLAALDASSTTLSVRGIISLARTLQISDSEELMQKLRGPWSLRILRMKHCTRIDDAIYPILSSMFPLLCVADLRGTKCRPPITSNGKLFSTCKDRRLFSSNLALSLDALQQTLEDIPIFSAPQQFQFVFRIKNLCHEDVARALADVDMLHRNRQPGRALSLRSNNWGGQNQRLHRGIDYTSNPEDCISSDSEEHEGHWGSDYFEADDDASVQACDEWGIWEENGKEVDSDDDKCCSSREEGKGGGLSSDGERRYANMEQQPSTRPSTTKRDFLNGANQCSPTSPESLPSQGLHTLDSVKDITDEDDHASTSDSGDCQDQMNRFGSRLPVDAPRSHELYWYDSDRHRAGTYVPLSLALVKCDERLMLYRPARPWAWLEKERTMLLEKEAQWESAKANRTMPVTVSVGKKRLKVQEGLQSMTALALQRRRVNNVRTRVEPPRVVSRNLFTTKEKGSLLPETSAEIRGGFNTQKGRRTVSTPKYPEPTQMPLRRGPLTEPIIQEQGASVDSVLQKAKNSAPTPPTPNTLAVTSKTACGGICTTSMKREENHSKQQDAQFTEPISLPSSSTLINPPAKPDNAHSRLKISKSRRKDEDSRQKRTFSWVTWASRKQ